LQGGENRISPVDGKSNDGGDQAHRENDEIITDLQDGLLEMTDGVRLLNELRGLPEVGLGASGVDQRAALTSPNDRPRKHCIARVSRRGQGLTRQRGLIDRHRISVEQASVRRDDVA
jgi:hypothetical protein